MIPDAASPAQTVACRTAHRTTDAPRFESIRLESRGDVLHGTRRADRWRSRGHAATSPADVRNDTLRRNAPDETRDDMTRI